MRCSTRASNGPNHLGLCALQEEILRFMIATDHTTEDGHDQITEEQVELMIQEGEMCFDDNDDDGVPVAVGETVILLTPLLQPY